MSEVPYQRQPQIDQAEQEIETAKAYGQTDRVAAAEKTLRSLREDAGSKRKRAASDDDEVHAQPDKGPSFALDLLLLSLARTQSRNSNPIRRLAEGTGSTVRGSGLQVAARN